MSLRHSVAGQPSPDVIDALMDRYVAWREQSAAVQLAYESWNGAGRDRREDAYSDYVAALDREEWAAVRYERLIERVEAERDGAGRGPASLGRAA